MFAEGHVGVVGEGTGFRGFAGITLERLMKKGLNLPVNLLVGSRLFIVLIWLVLVTVLGGQHLVFA